jgi:hypothetical protein
MAFLSSSLLLKLAEIEAQGNFTKPKCVEGSPLHNVRSAPDLRYPSVVVTWFRV